MHDTREYFLTHYVYLFRSVGATSCMNCGNGGSLHLHHVVPLAIGGTNNVSNLVILCTECHARAHNSSNLIRAVQQGNRYDDLDYVKLSVLYNDKHMTAEEIATEIGCSASLVRKRLSLFNIPKQTAANRIVSLFKSMKNGEVIKACEIYRTLGIHRNTFRQAIKKTEVTNAMKHYGIITDKTFYRKELNIAS